MNDLNHVENGHTQVTHAALTPEQVELLKRTICKDATNDELKLFLHVCQRTGLDPFARQIYAVKRTDNQTNEKKMVIQTSIDGFRLAASRSGKYAGSDDPVLDDEDQPSRATVTVYKMVQGQRCAFTATARWKEYYPGEKVGFMWRKMPCVMLSKVAEALALRKAFPADLSGVYAKEEMDQAEIQDIPGKKTPEITEKPNIIVAPKVESKEKTRDQLAQEIVALGKQLNLGGAGLMEYIKEETGKGTKDLTVSEMEGVIVKLQTEIGRSGEMQ
jgi:phage recombination protein Bet